MESEKGTRSLNSDLLRQAAAGLGFSLSPAELADFERYAAELVAWNARVNLTRITLPDEIAILHFLDSLVCLRGVPTDAPTARLRCVDVGSGAGLPGLPLKLVRPPWSLTLVESVRKKAAFLEHVVAKLGLAEVTVVCARSEELGRDPGHRQGYDLAVARAVAELPVLAEYMLPLVRVGGRMLAPKGAAIADEVAAMAPALEILGGQLVEVLPYRLPGVNEHRQLVVVEKVAPTPEKYPRRPGIPAKRPIAAAD